jgi:hypothetical protein
MAKKSKSKKSKAKKTKSESPEAKSETPDEAKSPTEAVSPSFSTDDVYNLLKAVNEVTLKRMEQKNDTMAGDTANIKRFMDPMYSMLQTIQTTVVNDLTKVFPRLDRIETTLQVIRNKTDRLP